MPKKLKSKKEDDQKLSVRERINIIRSEVWDIAQKIIEAKVKNPNTRSSLEAIDLIFYADQLFIEYDKQIALRKSEEYAAVYAYAKLALDSYISNMTPNAISPYSTLDAIFEAISPEIYQEAHAMKDNWYRDKCQQEFDFIDSPERKPDEALATWCARLMGEDQDSFGYHDIYGQLNLGRFCRESQDICTSTIAVRIAGEIVSYIPGLNVSSFGEKLAEPVNTDKSGNRIQFSIDSQGFHKAQSISNIGQQLERLNPISRYSDDIASSVLLLPKSKKTEDKPKFSDVLQDIEFKYSFKEVGYDKNFERSSNADPYYFSSSINSRESPLPAELKAKSEFRERLHAYAKLPYAITPRKIDEYTNGIKKEAILSWNDGKWCVGALVKVPIERLIDPALLTFVPELAPLALPLVFIGCIGFYMVQESKQAKQEYHLNIANTQITGVSIEVKKIDKEIKKFDELRNQYRENPTPNLLQELIKEWAEIKLLIDTTEKKYNKFISGEEKKMTVAWVDPHYYRIRMQPKFEYTPNPKLSARENKKRKASVEKMNKRSQEIEPFYKTDQHKVTKEAKKFIQDILPRLSEINHAIQSDQAFFINNFLYYSQIEESEVFQKLCDLRDNFLDGTINEMEFDLKTQEIISELKPWKRTANRMLKGWALTPEEREQLSSRVIRLKENKKELNLIEKLTKEEKQFNTFSEQYRQGLISKEDFRDGVYKIGGDNKTNNDRIIKRFETVLNETPVNQYNEKLTVYNDKKKELTTLLDCKEPDYKKISEIALELGCMTNQMISILMEIQSNSSDDFYKEDISTKITNCNTEQKFWSDAVETNHENLTVMQFTNKVIACNSEYNDLNEIKEDIFSQFKKGAITEEELFLQIHSLEQDFFQFSEHAEKIEESNLANEELKRIFNLIKKQSKKFYDEAIWEVINKKIDAINEIVSQNYNTDERKASRFQLVIEIKQKWELLRNKSDENSFSIFSLILKSFTYEELITESLDFIEQYKFNYMNERELVIINFYEAIARRDKNLTSNAFEEAKSLENVEERLDYMGQCLDFLDKTNKIRLKVDMKLALSSATNLLNIKMQLDYLNETLSWQEKLKIECEECRAKNEENLDAVPQQQMEQLENRIKFSEAEAQMRYQKVKADIYYEKNVSRLLILWHINYAITFIDFAQLLDDYLAKQFNWSIEYVHSFSNTAGLIFSALYTLGELFFLEKVTIDEIAQKKGIIDNRKAASYTLLLQDLDQVGTMEYIHSQINILGKCTVVIKLILACMESFTTYSYESYLICALKYFTSMDLDDLKKAIGTLLKKDDKLTVIPAENDKKVNEHNKLTGKDCESNKEEVELNQEISSMAESAKKLIEKINKLNSEELSYKKETFYPKEIKILKSLLLSDRKNKKNCSLSEKLVLLSYEECVNMIQPFANFEIEDLKQIKELITEHCKEERHEDYLLLRNIYNLKEEGYDLCLMSEIDENGPKSNKLYLIIDNDQIKYRTNLTPGSDYIELGGEISQQSGELYRAIHETKLAGLSQPCKEALLNETSKRGHTLEESEEYRDAIFFREDIQIIDAFLQRIGQQHLRDKLVRKEIIQRIIDSKDTNAVKKALEGFTQLQLISRTIYLLNECYTERIAKFKELLSVPINFSGITSVIRYIGPRFIPNEWYIAFMINLVQNMNSSNMLGVVSRNDTTLLNFLGRVFKLDSLILMEMPICKVIYCINFLYAVKKACLETGDIILNERISSLHNQFQNKLDALSRGKVDEKSTFFKNTMADLCFNLKCIIRHRDKMKHLYFQVVFLQHYFEGTITVPISLYGNGLFEAVSCYTEESAQQLKQLTNLYSQVPQQSQLNQLSQALNRPIIVIYGSRESILSRDFLRNSYTLEGKGFAYSDFKCDGNPIYILLNEREKRFHGLTINEEYYLKHLSKTLDKKESRQPQENHRFFLQAGCKPKLSNEQAAKIIENLRDSGFNVEKNAAVLGLPPRATYSLNKKTHRTDHAFFSQKSTGKAHTRGQKVARAPLQKFT